MSAAVRGSFRDQADACETLGSPFTARLLRMLASRLEPGGAVADRVLDWSGDPSSRGDAVALRLAGGLHALVLAGTDARLAAVYAAPEPVDEVTLAAAVLPALERHKSHLLQWLSSPPQTNDVRRSAVLIGAAHWLMRRVGLPLVISELGASAGLNLIWDRYCLIAGGHRFGPDDAALTLRPDWRGSLPPSGRPQVADRAGVDLRPLDPVTDRQRILSYIWADQTDRLTRTARALDEAARLRPPVSRGDAVDWLETRLATPHPGHLHLVCHTVTWQYLPAAARTRGEALLAAAGAQATREAPLAHLAMEADDTPVGAAVTLTLWPGAGTIALGRADFHGRWVDWRAPAE